MSDRPNHVRAFGACVLAAAALAGCGDGRSPRPTGTVTVGQRTWRVELALTPNERALGLQFRTELAPDEGMLFVFPSAQPVRFHMRNCRIPLDVAFIGADRRVIHTTTMAVESGQSAGRTYPSGGPALYVLEVPAGELAKAGVEPGDEVTFSASVPERSAR